VFFNLPKFFLLSLVFAYIYISQGRVETHLHYCKLSVECASEKILKICQ